MSNLATMIDVTNHETAEVRRFEIVEGSSLTWGDIARRVLGRESHPPVTLVRRSDREVMDPQERCAETSSIAELAVNSFYETMTQGGGV